MLESRGSIIYTRVLGFVAIAASVCLVCAAVVRDRDSAIVYLRDSAVLLIGACFVFASFRRPRWSAVTGICGFLCLAIADLVKWRHGLQSLADALIPWGIIAAVIILIMIFLIWRQKGPNAA
jgi:hypothetical protein